MTEFDVLRTAASGMDAQRISLDIAARNVAASEADGAFTRMVPRFAMRGGSVDDEDAFSDIPDDESVGEDTDAEEGDSPLRFLGTQAQRGVDVDAVTEMVSVLDAQRAYEANASVFDAGKRLMERTIDLGRL
jgi:flagellar basal-body rod protein FlgC